MNPVMVNDPRARQPRTTMDSYYGSLQHTHPTTTTADSPHVVTDSVASTLLHNYTSYPPVTSPPASSSTQPPTHAPNTRTSTSFSSLSSSSSNDNDTRAYLYDTLDRYVSNSSDDDDDAAALAFNDAHVAALAAGHDDNDHDHDHDHDHDIDDDTASDSLYHFAVKCRRRCFPVLVHTSLALLGLLLWSLVVEYAAGVYTLTWHNTSPTTSKLGLLAWSVYFVPCVLGLRRVRTWLRVQKTPVLALPILLGLTAAFIHSRSGRVVVQAPALAALLLLFASEFAGSRASRRRAVRALLAGLLALLELRFSFFSLNPLWYNTPFVVCTMVCTVAGLTVLWRWERRFIRRGYTHTRPLSVSSLYFVRTDDDAQAEETELSHATAPFLHWLRTGLGLGSCVFLAHLMLTGHSVVARWAGMAPYPACLWVIFSLALGTVVADTKATQNGISWLLSAVGSALLSFTDGRLAVFGGCLIAFALPGFLFLFISKLVPRRCGRTFALSTSSYLALVYASAGVVEPTHLAAGLIFGNRPWLLLLIVHVMLLLPLSRRRFTPRLRQVRAPSRPSLFLIASLAFFGMIPGILSRAAGDVPAEHDAPLVPLQPPIGFLLGAGATIRDVNSDWSEYCPNVHAVHLDANRGFHASGLVNFADVASSLADLDPQLVVVSSANTARISSGNRDMVEYLAHKLHMYNRVFRSPREPGPGVAILSSYVPYDVHSTELDLPTAHSLHLRVRTFNGSVWSDLSVIGAHLPVETHERGLRSTRALADLADSLPASRLLLLADIRASYSSDILAPLSHLDNVFADTPKAAHSHGYAFARNLNITRHQVQPAHLAKHPALSIQFTG